MLAVCSRRTVCGRIVIWAGAATSPCASTSSQTESPGSRPYSRDLLDRVIRVDHAGELGADRIYAGQMFVLGNSKVGPVIKHMWEQEKEHLQTFERLIFQHQIRPTVLLPIWNVAGFLLGAGTAALGKEAAMACTVAVEETISEHYNSQIRDLVEDDPERHKDLIKTISKFRDDEMEHHDTGLHHDAEKVGKDGLK